MLRSHLNYAMLKRMHDEPSPDYGASPSGSAALGLPRLPALGWATFAGSSQSPLPCVLDAPNLRFTTSGRAAIALALRAAGVGAGARVLVPTYHCPTMIAPIVAAGAEPVFFPIDGSGAPRLDAFGERQLGRVRAMIAAHYFGLPQPMAGLRAFCDTHRIALIEDCAHALFGTSDGRPVGQWGDYAVASLTKFLPVVDGGCLVSRTPLERVPPPSPLSLASELKSLANAAETGARHRRLPGVNRLLVTLFNATTWWRTQRQASVAFERSHGDEVREWLADFDPPSAVERAASRWTIWTARHAKRARIVSLRRRNYRELARLVADIPGVRALMPQLPDAAAPYVFPLVVERPEAVYQQVRAAGIPVFRWDESWPTCMPIPGDAGAAWSMHVFQIGCHQDLAFDELAQITRALAGILGRAADMRDAARPPPVSLARPAAFRRV